MVEHAGSIPADLFVDCSDPGAAILSQLADARRIDWQAYIPVREVLIAKAGQPRPSTCQSHGIAAKDETPGRSMVNLP